MPSATVVRPYWSCSNYTSRVTPLEGSFSLSRSGFILPPPTHTFHVFALVGSEIVLT